MPKYSYSFKDVSVLEMIELKQQPFTGKENFTLWQRRMRNTLGQQGLSVVLAGKDMKLETMTSEEWDMVDELGRGSIENYIDDEVMFNMIEDIAKQILKSSNICMQEGHFQKNTFLEG